MKGLQKGRKVTDDESIKANPSPNYYSKNRLIQLDIYPQIFLIAYNL
jgi:hypothetical protein